MRSAQVVKTTSIILLSEQFLWNNFMWQNILLLPPIPLSIRVFSNKSTLHMRWPEYWSFSISIIPSKEHLGLISFRMDWLDILAVQGHPIPVPLPGKSHGRRSFTFTFHFHALEKEMATRSSVLAWRIPGTEEPGGLPSMGSHRVGHDWSDLAAAAAAKICPSIFNIKSILIIKNY